MLAGIIGSLAVGGVVGALTPVAMPVAVVVFGAVAVGITGHALFVDGPVDGVDDLAEEVAESPTEELPLVE